MPTGDRLAVSIGQYSDKGRKASNQDFHAHAVPPEPQRTLKGVALAMADGISSSDVSQIASETAVTSFLDDYYCTSEAWSVRHSVQQVVSATNAWLHSQSQRSPYRDDRNRGYVCTFGALVIKAATAHVFHAGDTRIYRIRNGALEQLTNDHRLWVSRHQSYLGRALGMAPQVELDYQSLPVQAGDIYMLATDGVYEFADAQFLLDTVGNRAADLNSRDLHPVDLNQTARQIVAHALNQGSEDNLSIQILRVDDVPQHPPNGIHRQMDELPLPPLLSARDTFDGYTIVREIHASSRSHVYLALDNASGKQVVLKTPSIDLRADSDYLERLLMEEWIARRVTSTHVIKADAPERQRNFLYTVTEFIEGQTLKQWLIDNPAPELETVRGLIDQIARGLYALHRMDVLHQDLKPDNILIDKTGTVKIIDLGAARVAGLVEARGDGESAAFPGTALYMAPEYFIGELGTTCSDLYSLAVLAYHMLSGCFPYDNQVAKCHTVAAQRRLSYRSVLDNNRAIPMWVDETLKKALHPNPDRRYQELSEFTHDLRHPNKAYINKTRPPLIERNPVRFWQGVSVVLATTVLALLILRG